MDILITGVTGLVGRYLAGHLLAAGHRIIGIGSRQTPPALDDANFTYIAADTTRQGDWQESLNQVDAVVNLAGRTIFRRWTRRYKQSIRDSRLLTTANLVAALPRERQVTMVSTSAVGYYGSRGDDLLTENATPGDDFLAQLAQDWEAEALDAQHLGHRVVIARFGVVLGRGGGALGQMVPAFRSFLGGPLGSGAQWFPWIHIQDLAAAVEFVLSHQQMAGPFNFCAPQPIQNRDLARSLGRVLNRPAVLPAPALMVRLALGEFGGVLLASQRAVPEQLLQQGFRFEFPEIEGALRQLLKTEDG